MNSSPSQASPRRRVVLAGLGVGLGGVIAGAMGWQWAKGRTIFAKAPLPSRPQTSSPASADVPEPAEPVVVDMTREWFEPYLNTDFRVKVSALTATTVKLTEVSPAQVITNKDKGVSYTTFSLTFTGPKSLSEESQIYRVQHEALGEMDLFLTPVGKHARERRLEAVFSQRI